MLISNLKCIIDHKTMDPEEITNAIGLQPYLVHKSGEPVVAPNGHKFGGFYSWSKWGYKIDLNNKDSLLDQLTALIDHLYPHQDYIRAVIEDGGRVAVFFSLSCPEHVPFQMKPEVMQKMVDMNIEFGFEIFG